jgi:phage gpG-like protein
MAEAHLVRGGEKLVARIAAIRANLRLPDLTEEIGVLLLRRTLDRFDRETDPDGNPWVPLAKSTETVKRRKGYGDARMLVRTGDLRKSIRLIRGGLGSTFTNTGAGVRIGVQGSKVAKYARAQNKGYGHIPARRFLGIGRLDIRAVDALMKRKANQIEARS